MILWSAATCIATALVVTAAISVPESTLRPRVDANGKIPEALAGGGFAVLAVRPGEAPLVGQQGKARDFFESLLLSALSRKPTTYPKGQLL